MRKAQISFVVTAKLIRAFVFARQIVLYLFYLYPKFQASGSFLCLCSSVCVRPVRKPHSWFSHEAAHVFSRILTILRKKKSKVRMSSKKTSLFDRKYSYWLISCDTQPRYPALTSSNICVESLPSWH